MKIAGSKVKEARRAKLIDGRPMNREQLAVAIGVSYGTIERVERGVGDVAAGTAYLIAVELDVPLDSLFTEGEAVA